MVGRKKTCRRKNHKCRKRKSLRNIRMLKKVRAKERLRKGNPPEIFLRKRKREGRESTRREKKTKSDSPTPALKRRKKPERKENRRSQKSPRKAGQKNDPGRDAEDRRRKMTAEHSLLSRADRTRTLLRRCKAKWLFLKN